MRQLRRFAAITVLAGVCLGTVALPAFADRPDNLGCPGAFPQWWAKAEVPGTGGDRNGDGIVCWGPGYSVIDNSIPSPS